MDAYITNEFASEIMPYAATPRWCTRNGTYQTMMAALRSAYETFEPTFRTKRALAMSGTSDRATALPSTGAEELGVPAEVIAMPPGPDVSGPPGPHSTCLRHFAGWRSYHQRLGFMPLPPGPIDR
jgi:hypothetical protein